MKYTLTAILLLLACCPAMAKDLRGTVSVIDGDTLDLHGQRIRLYGIDAPESGQSCTRNEKSWRCGKDAAYTLSDLIGRKSVSCTPEDTDRYGRIVAVCIMGTVNLNDWMVRNGWAVAYRHYSDAYADAEAEAKADQRGIWQGQFDMPWEWRSRKWHR